MTLRPLMLVLLFAYDVTSLDVLQAARCTMVNNENRTVQIG